MFLGTPHNGSDSILADAVRYTSLLQDTWRTDYLAYEPQRSVDEYGPIIDVEAEVQANFARRPPQGKDLVLPTHVIRLTRRPDGPNPLLSQKKIGLSPHWPELPKTTLTLLNEFFINSWAESPTFWIVNIRETTKVKGMMVVSEAAADLRIPKKRSDDYRVVTLPMPNVNHIEICKFAREDDPNYRVVLSWLEEMTAYLFPLQVKEEKQQLFIDQMMPKIQQMSSRGQKESQDLFRQGEALCKTHEYRSEVWKRFIIDSCALFPCL